jgi:hypothetical protein
MAFREVEEPLLEKRWEIDCVEMTLTQNDMPTPRVYQGKGFLRQDGEGVVRYRLYPTSDGNIPGSLLGSSPGNAGKLLPDDAYYSLSATDWYGRVWKCPRVNPDFSTTYCADERHRLVAGKAYDLVSEEKGWIPENAYFIKMVYRVNLDIPANAATDVITHIAGKEAGRSGSLNVAVFGTEFGQFMIRAESGKLMVTCDADRPPQSNFFTRITEALSFVLGRRLYWNFMEEHREGKKITRLCGQQQSDERRLPEPVGGSRRDFSGDTWRLFSDFLRFIDKHDGEKLHRCSQHLFSVYQARQGTIEAKALALGVAVEGVCKKLFPQTPEAEAQIKGWVEDLRKHCESWPGFTSDPTGKAALWDRLDGSIKQLTNVRAKDILMRLVKQGAVREQHVKAWNRLRNLAAHPNVNGSVPTQDLVNLCNAVTVLLYHLIFHAIGYAGPYTDYSEYGYPPKRYSGLTEKACGGETTTAPMPTDEEFDRSLDELASDATLPPLPADFSRADIYTDHD